MIYLGIDPGKSGAIAAIDVEAVTMHGPVVVTSVRTIKLSDPEIEILMWINRIKKDVALVVMEHLTGGGRPDERAGQGNMFKLGMSVGACRMALAAVGLLAKTKMVVPMKWQRDLGIPKRGKKTEDQHKGVLFDKAAELFPQIRVTKATQDALLLAHYARGLKV